MKNLITFLISCLSMTALLAQVKNESRVEVRTDSPTETVLHFTLEGVDLQQVATPRGAASLPIFKGGTPLLEAGAPDLPKWAGALMIPATGGTSVEVVSAKFEDIAEVDIAPSKGDLKRTVDPAKVPFHYGPAFEANEFFPGKLAVLQQPFVMRAARGQAVWLFPVQYNPVRRVLRVYSEITVRVFANGEKGANELPADRPALGDSRVFRDIYRQAFLNFKTTDATRGNGSEMEKMLVVAADHLLPELENWVVWKKQSGIAVSVVPMSEIGSTQSAVVYNYVRDRYLADGISYLMLVGDDSAINPEMRDDGGLYSCDNCFGYMDGTDHLPEILVGRLNAATPAQLKIMVNRILEYEKTPLVDTAQNWCATGMASTSNQGAGIGDDGQADYEQGNEWKAKHLADGFEQYWEFYDGDQSAISPTPGDATADRPGSPQSNDLTSLMNSRGASLYNYTGHGWEQGLVSGNFDVNAVQTLTNAHRYPVIIAVACCAGHFTSNTGDCLGEAVQRAGNEATGEPYGAICGFFSSDFQSWSPPMEGQDGMNQYLLDADGITLRPAMSAMLAVGNAKMIAAYAGGGELMADFWNPFTDPTTMPRTALPQPIAATHQPSAFIGTNSLSITCDVEGALVALYWQGEPIGVGVVENGVAVINFPSLNTVGDLTVTITQFNHIPYQSAVAVVPSAGPFVVSQNIELDDATGDADHKADFGENIRLNVKLANVGLVPATATSLKISTLDAGVMLTDDEEIFGDIEDSTSVERTAAFAFAVADDVPDGKVVTFNLHLTFSDSMGYDFALPVKLQAPALAIGSFVIDDAGSGNGNGRLDGGETVSVRVQNLNKGKSQSPAAVGTLTSDSPWLTISQSFNLGQLAASTGSADAVFTVKVADNAPKSQTANFEYQVAAGKYSASQTFDGHIINAIVEDFEQHNFTTFPWQMGGSKPWIITILDVYEGQYCSRSGAISHNQQSQMSLTINVLEQGTVSFARRVMSEQDYDFLHFKIDDEIMDSWSGQQDWAEVLYPVSEGLHTLTWSYEKDAFGTDNPDKAWVDNVILPPHEVVVGTKNAPDADAFGLSVSPNPTSGAAFVSFELAENQDVSLVVTDLLGRPLRAVFSQKRMAAGAHVERLELAGLPSGVYLVQLRGAAGTGAAKLVRE